MAAVIPQATSVNSQTSSQQLAEQFDLPSYYEFVRYVDAGTFGKVCEAKNKAVILQHTYQGDGKRKTFRVNFNYLYLDDQDSITALVNERPTPFRLTVPHDTQYPLYVEFDTAPPKRAKVQLRAHERVAIKKVFDVFRDLDNTKYTLRELKLLQLLNHPNVINLVDVFLPPHAEKGWKWKDIYLVFELMFCSLRKMIKSEQILDKSHISYIMYQIFCGVKALHDLDIMHRDLKTQNILLSNDWSVKICDLGMARRVKQEDYNYCDGITTIWYCSPEMLSGYHNYSKEVDMWSCGTILGEILGRKTLFPGSNQSDMARIMLRVLGNPKEEDIFFLPTPLQQKIREKNEPGWDWRAKLASAPPEALDLLLNLLQFNPKKRFTVREALQHVFVSEYRTDLDDLEPAQSGLSWKKMEPLPASKVDAFTTLLHEIQDVCVAANRSEADKYDLLATYLPQLISLWPDTAEQCERRLGWNRMTQTMARGVNFDQVYQLMDKLDQYRCKLDSEVHDRRQRMEFPWGEDFCHQSVESIHSDTEEVDSLDAGYRFLTLQVKTFHDDHEGPPLGNLPFYLSTLPKVPAACANPSPPPSPPSRPVPYTRLSRSANSASTWSSTAATAACSSYQSNLSFQSTLPSESFEIRTVELIPYPYHPVQPVDTTEVTPDLDLSVTVVPLAS